MRRKLVWTAAGFAALFLASSTWAPAQRGGRPVTPPPTGGGRPGGTTGGIGGTTGRPPVGGGSTTRPIPGGTGAAGKAAKAEVKSAFETARGRSPLDAAKVLRETGPSALSRPERAVMLNAVAHQFLHQQQQISTDQRLAALRQFRADWLAVGPGAGLDPLVELELAAAESAAERLALSRALRFIQEKQYELARAELAPLADSRYLPVPVARAIPGLLADLTKLSWLVRLNPDGELPQGQLTDAYPAAVKRAVSAVEVVRRAGELFSRSALLRGNPGGDALRAPPPDPEPRLAAVERVFGAKEAGRVRVELSASLFLVGRGAEAFALLEGDVDAEHAREVLADLRTAVVGGQLANAQVTMAVPADGPAAVLAPLATPREKWRAPTAPADETTTLARLEKLARKDVATAVAEAVGPLVGRVEAQAEAIRTELAKQAGPLAPFEEKVKARLGRPFEKDEGALVAVAALRGLTVDDAVALLAADADRPAQAGRVLGAALGPVAHLVVAARPPVSLKDGADGAFRLSADVTGHNRAKLRDTARSSLRAGAEDGTATAALRAAEKGTPIRPAFEEAVAKGCGLPGGQAHSPPELVVALLDSVRDLTAEYARAAAEWRELNEVLEEIDERDYDDPKDRDAIGRAKSRLAALARDTSAGGLAVALGCALLGEYGPDAAPALPWLRAAADGAPWRASAASAVTRITAPVPKPAPPQVECVLTLGAKKGPLDENAFTVEVKNNTDKDIELLSTLPGGMFVFLDVAIEGPDGKRTSPEFYDRSVASPFAPPPRLVGTLEAKKSQRLELVSLARYVEKMAELKPGKYRVRVKFEYKEHAATSEWVPFEINKDEK